MTMLPTVFIVWLEFALCAAAIATAGTMLSRYGDIFADKTGLCGAWIGLALMASVTSLPELVTGVSPGAGRCAEHRAGQCPRCVHYQPDDDRVPRSTATRR
jgi:hypothetical protein